jgi:hypothetical protein
VSRYYHIIALNKYQNILPLLDQTPTEMTHTQASTYLVLVPTRQASHQVRAGRQAGRQAGSTQQASYI